MTPLFGNAKGRTSFKLKEVHRLYINYLNGMMFRLQEQFQRDPNQNIIIEGTPNDLTYMITLLWYMQNGRIGFENEENGNYKMVYKGNLIEI